MKDRIALFALVGLLLLPTLSTPAAAQQNSIIARVNNLGLPLLNQVEINTICNPIPLLLQICNVVQGLGDPLGQVFEVTPVNQTVTQLLTSLLSLLCPQGSQGLTCIVDAELNQAVSIVDISLGDLIAPANLNDTTTVQYYGTNASEGYTNQPAVGIINLTKIQSKVCSPNSCGAGTVADVDTGVDPNQMVLQGVLLTGYDFTRNEAGGWETRDINNGQPLNVTAGQTSDYQVNQMSMAVLNGCPNVNDPLCPGNPYTAFGHGTMVSGIIHLVAPTAKILPLKAFDSKGQGLLSNVLRAIYYGTKNNATILNMSFDLTTSSQELQDALTYANDQGVVSVASTGNDGKEVGNGFEVYPASLSTVMAIASTSNNDTLSSFSNYGAPPTLVGAPGEGIVSTYPYNTYAAGWGTSFSAPFVSGTVALMRGVGVNINRQTATHATCHAVNINNPGVGYGRLDAYDAVTNLSAKSCPNN